MLSRNATLLTMLFCLLVPHRATQAADDVEQVAWSALRSGTYIVLMRHAQTEPGIGDPKGFTLEDCSTQRNLSAQGREDARRIGEAFKQKKIPVSEVLSSRWCRCIDTGRIAFGKVSPAPMLDSSFTEEGEATKKKVRQVFAAAMQPVTGGNRIWITHNVNIQAVTGLSLSSGEMLVVEPGLGPKFNVIGRISVPR